MDWILSILSNPLQTDSLKQVREEAGILEMDPLMQYVSLLTNLV